MPMHFYLEVLQVVSLVEAGTVIKEQVPSAFPLPAESTPPTEQTLNYILDIYVTGENKILYPPLLLPYYHNATGMPIRFETGEEEQTEQYFDRNQYSDIFYNAKRSDFVIMKSELERADKIKYSNDKLVISNPAEGQEETTESTVFYIIKDDKMYFHIAFLLQLSSQKVY